VAEEKIITPSFSPEEALIFKRMAKIVKKGWEFKGSSWNGHLFVIKFERNGLTQVFKTQHAFSKIKGDNGKFF